MKYRKKPVVIEAQQLTKDSADKVFSWVWENSINRICRLMRNESSFHMEIETLEGKMRADENDWIIKGIKGEFYPCKPDIFEATYEAVDE
jgi:hypothetical protein